MRKNIYLPLALRRFQCCILLSRILLLLLSGVRQCLGEPCELTASAHIDKDKSSLFLRIREIPTPTHSDTSFVHYLLITVSSQHQGAPKHTYGHIKVQIYSRAHLPSPTQSQFHHLFITDSSPDHPLMPTFHKTFISRFIDCS